MSKKDTNDITIDNHIKSIKINDEYGVGSEVEVESNIYLGDIKIKDFLDFLKDFPTEYNEYDEDGDYTIEDMNLAIALKEFIGAFADTKRIKAFAYDNHRLMLKDCQFMGQRLALKIKYDTIDKDIPF